MVIGKILVRWVIEGLGGKYVYIFVYTTEMFFPNMFYVYLAAGGVVVQTIHLYIKDFQTISRYLNVTNIRHKFYYTVT